MKTISQKELSARCLNTELGHLFASGSRTRDLKFPYLDFARELAAQRKPSRRVFLKNFLYHFHLPFTNNISNMASTQASAAEVPLLDSVAEARSTLFQEFLEFEVRCQAVLTTLSIKSLYVCIGSHRHL